MVSVSYEHAGLQIQTVRAVGEVRRVIPDEGSCLQSREEQLHERLVLRAGYPVIKQESDNRNNDISSCVTAWLLIISSSQAARELFQYLRRYHLAGSIQARPTHPRGPLQTTDCFGVGKEVSIEGLDQRSDDGRTSLLDGCYRGRKLHREARNSRTLPSVIRQRGQHLACPRRERHLLEPGGGDECVLGDNVRLRPFRRARCRVRVQLESTSVVYWY